MLALICRLLERLVARLVTNESDTSTQFIDEVRSICQTLCKSMEKLNTMIPDPVVADTANTNTSLLGFTLILTIQQLNKLETML